jgi:hypothetical protein
VSNELWPERKHQIIAEKIEGWVQTDWKPECKWQLPNGKISWNPPNYSSSLDLVARAEAKVGELGAGVMYKYWTELEAHLKVKVKTWDTVNDKALFMVITAPAATRVNALVALAQMGVFDEK